MTRTFLLPDQARSMARVSCQGGSEAMFFVFVFFLFSDLVVGLFHCLRYLVHGFLILVFLSWVLMSINILRFYVGLMSSVLVAVWWLAMPLERLRMFHLERLAMASLVGDSHFAEPRVFLLRLIDKLVVLLASLLSFCIFFKSLPLASLRLWLGILYTFKYYPLGMHI